MRSTGAGRLLGGLCCFAIATSAVIAAAPEKEGQFNRYDPNLINRMVNTTGEHNAPTGDVQLRGAPFTIALSGATLMQTYTTSEGSTHDTGIDADNNGMIDPGDNPTCDTNDADVDGDGVFGFVFLPLPACRPAQLDQLAPGTNGAPGHHWTVYWREEGSVGGIEDLVDSQLFAIPAPDPDSDNPIWVNRNELTAPGTLGGFTIDVNNGSPMPAFQMAVSDVKSFQAFGSGDPNDAQWNRRPGEQGYGLNPNTDNTGNNATDPALRNETTLGPDGTGILFDQTVGIGTISVYANPLLGYEEITDRELQWLLVHGRLSNGIDLNFVCRDVNSGTRNGWCNNLLVDVSWGQGEDDGGGPRGPADRIGTQLRFSDKVSSSIIKQTVLSNAYTMGYNSLSRGAPDSISNQIDILRVEYTSATILDPNDPIGETGVAVLPDVDTIIDGTYRITTQQQYIRMLKDPNDPTYDPNLPDACPGNWPFRGDPDCAVRDYVRNLFTSTDTFPNIGTAFTPADALLANRFVIPAAMDYLRELPGGAPGNILGGDGDPYILNPDQDLALRATIIGNFAFGTIDPSVVTGLYDFDPDGAGPLVDGDTLMPPDRLAGDFDRNGVRDLNDVDDFVVAILGDPNRPCTPCTETFPNECDPPAYVYTNPVDSSTQHPYVMGADAIADACLNEADVLQFCRLLTNDAGHLAKNECMDRAIAANTTLNAGAGGLLSLFPHEDINQDGAIDAADVVAVNDVLCRGASRTLTITDFDDAFVIGDNSEAEQNDDGVIDDTDLNLVLAAGGMTIDQVLDTPFSLADSDGDVDLGDFATFSLCFAGPNVPPAGSCPGGVNADFDGDGDVDLGDFAAFSLCFGGANNPAPSNGCYCN